LDKSTTDFTEEVSKATLPAAMSCARNERKLKKCPIADFGKAKRRLLHSNKDESLPLQGRVASV
jgi:hypothetical protein